ncbi:MAG: RNA polymerase sigma factor [Planctomycetota bacterium]
MLTSQGLMEENTTPDDERPTPAGSKLGAEPSFSDLVARICHGDRAALAELAARETPRLMRRLERRIPASLRRRIGASDLVQMTLADLAAKQDALEDRGVAAFRRLVTEIADGQLARAFVRERAQRRDMLREQRVEPRSDVSGTHVAGGISQIPGSVATPSQALALTEEVAQMRAAFPRLSASDQEIIRWIDYEEISYDEVAQRLDISVKTAQKRHSRAVSALREILRVDNKEK